MLNGLNKQAICVPLYHAMNWLPIALASPATLSVSAPQPAPADGVSGMPFFNVPRLFLPCRTISDEPVALY